MIKKISLLLTIPGLLYWNISIGSGIDACRLYGEYVEKISHDEDSHVFKFKVLEIEGGHEGHCQIFNDSVQTVSLWIEGLPEQNDLRTGSRLFLVYLKLTDKGSVKESFSKGGTYYYEAPKNH